MRRILAIFLLINILTSSVGLTFASHYCGGYLAKFKVALGTPDLDCGMKKTEATCSQKKDRDDSQLKREACCKNEYGYSSSDNTTVEKTAIQSISLKSFVILHHIFQGLSPLKVRINIPHTYHSPPLIEHDIFVLVQSFLL